MEHTINIPHRGRGRRLVLAAVALLAAGTLLAQEDAPPAATTVKPVKNTFESIYVIDNQTVMVPAKGTFEMDIQHRFGTVNNGSEDVWGIFAPSNIRLAVAYAPVNRLFVGAGLTKEKIELDLNTKYALLLQKPGLMPVSVTYFGNATVDLRNKENFREDVHRLSFFNQLLIARKITKDLSLQVAPSVSWFNNVEAYVTSKGEIESKMNNAHVAIAFSGRYKFTEKTALLVNYDQPLTEHLTNNPHPNISFGLEFNTSAHAFQIFAGNYYSIGQQRNNMFNQNDYRHSGFLVGFNITRLWSF
ncbi:MAG TPA: DUF5777 family beta-barrel protein [Flavisolibacter sp.]